MSSSSPATGLKPRGPHNTLGLDYAAEAVRLGPPRDDLGREFTIIDAHSHIHGQHAAQLYDRARRLFGVALTYSMTQLPHAQAVKDQLGDSIRFMTIPTWSAPDKDDAHRRGYLRTIEEFSSRFNARVMKVWASPRLRDFVPNLKDSAFGATDLAEIDAPWRVEHCKLAASLGMMFMVHVADPDTWFAKKYPDSARYGTKRQQYIGLERMLDRFPQPWIGAHMGGWPEDLLFLDSLLERHPNLHLDTSATKWIVRELSRHTRDEVLAFLLKWEGRVLFGTDLVTMDDQLQPAKTMGSAMGDLASSPDEAFELYCSRLWAQRMILESDYEGPSPIADSDLKMVDPDRHDAMSSPPLRGFNLPRSLLRTIYRGAAERLLGAWWGDKPAA